MKKIALAIAGLLIATPSSFANVEEANMFQDLGYIKASCIYDVQKVDKKRQECCWRLFTRTTKAIRNESPLCSSNR